MLHSIFFISNHRFNINIFHALKNMCFHIRILLFKLSDELLNLYSLRLILFIVTCRTCICELACTLDKAKIDQIRNIREGKASYGGQNGNPYGNPYGNAGNGGGGYYGGFSWEDIFGSGFGGFSQQQEATTELTAARNYINAGHYREALNVLNSVDSSQRNARWYYFHALANYGIGNRIEAMSDAEQAVRMEPDNFEYKQLLSRMKNGGATYQQYGGGSPIVCGTSNICLDLCIANMLCGMCCRPC